MKKKVAMIETGSDRPITKVLQPSRRKKKISRMREQAAEQRFLLAPRERVVDELALVLDRLHGDAVDHVGTRLGAGIGRFRLHAGGAGAAARAGGFHARERLAHRVGGADGVGVAFLVDGQLDRLVALEADHRLAFLVALRDGGDVLQAHGHAVGHGGHHSSRIWSRLLNWLTVRTR
jgi:hypothetical protein